MKKTRMVAMATMTAFCLTAAPAAVHQDTGQDVAKQRINAPVEQAKQRINVAPKGAQLAKQRINATTNKG